jgi:serine/threonine protein kinase
MRKNSYLHWHTRKYIDSSVKLSNSFLVNMHFAFQDRENLYLVIDLMSGGDLRYHMAKHRKFTEY